MKFDSLSLNPDILKGIVDAGFEHCTPIQEQSLPECLAGKDVIAQSQTGSGKTAVFLLTIFGRLLEAGPSETGKPRALVMVPTRELATQVIDDAVKLGKYLPLKSVAIYGGVDYDKQRGALKEGVDLVVATPGRMIDLYKSKTLSLDSIDIFVIDEADRMFDMGFAPDIMYIAGKLPKNKPRQTMLFSATIDSNVRRLASRYMLPDPVMIEIEPEQVTVNTIDQKVFYVSNEEKMAVLLTLLKRPEVERSIIFTNMKTTAAMLGWKLAGNGIPAKILTGDLSQDRRQKIIEGMKSGKIKTLVATDVAARGLHIEGITHVINYDLPDDAANYVHRIGRTARAGKSGTAYSLACEKHVLNLPDIEKYIERKIESEWVEPSEMAADVAPPFNERHQKHGDRHGKGKPFEKRERRPDGGRRQGKPAFSKDGKEERRGRTHQAPAKKIEAVEAAPATETVEKQEAQPSTTQRPQRRRRPQDRKKETSVPGFNVEKPERKHRDRHREDRPRGERQSRPERHKTERPRQERPVEHHRPTVAESAASAVAFKPEVHHKPHATERAAPEAKEKKPGLLKRFLKKILKKD